MSQTDNQNTKIPREPVTARGILVPVAAGIIMGLIVLWIRDGFSPCDEATLWTNLTDALTVPGVILTCIGLMSVVSEHGVFDGISFPIRLFLGQRQSEEKRAAMPKTYYDYVTARREKQRLRPRTTLVVGLFFLALAAAALIVCMNKG